MVGAVLIVAAVLVGCCLAVSAYVESAGAGAWTKRFSRAPDALPPENSTPWTRRNAMPDFASDAQEPPRLQPDNGYARCMLCDAVCECPMLGVVHIRGRYYLEMSICSECWPKAAQHGVSLFIPPTFTGPIFRESATVDVDDTN